MHTVICLSFLWKFIGIVKSCLTQSGNTDFILGDFMKHFDSLKVSCQKCNLESPSHLLLCYRTSSNDFVMQMIQNESWMVLSNCGYCLKGLNVRLCWTTCVPGTTGFTHDYVCLMLQPKNGQWQKSAVALVQDGICQALWRMLPAVLGHVKSSMTAVSWHSSSLSLLWKGRKLSLLHRTFWAQSKTHQQKTSISHQRAGLPLRRGWKDFRSSPINLVYLENI